MTLHNTNVTDFLIEGKEANRIALRLLHSEHSYGELRTATADIAAYLVELGCRNGDRVLLVSDSSFFWVAGYLGILSAGLVCVPLPTTIPPEDLRYIMDVTEARVALTQASFAVRNHACFGRIHLLTDTEISALPALLSQA